MNAKSPTLLFILSGLPILAYPFIFIANVMSLAAQPSANASFILQLASKSFQYSSLLYPIVFLACIFLYRKSKNMRYVYFPLYYLAFVAIALILWYLADK